MTCGGGVWAKGGGDAFRFMRTARPHGGPFHSPMPFAHPFSMPCFLIHAYSVNFAPFLGAILMNVLRCGALGGYTIHLTPTQALPITLITLHFRDLSVDILLTIFSFAVGF